MANLWSDEQKSHQAIVKDKVAIQTKVQQLLGINYGKCGRQVERKKRVVPREALPFLSSPQFLPLLVSQMQQSNYVMYMLLLIPFSFRDIMVIKPAACRRAKERWTERAANADSFEYPPFQKAEIRQIYTRIVKNENLLEFWLEQTEFLQFFRKKKAEKHS